MSANNAISDPRLVGFWESAQGPEKAIVKQGSGKAYSIEYFGENGVENYQGMLCKLGDRYVLDLSPDPAGKEKNNIMPGLALNAHLFLVLKIANDSVELTPLNPDSLLGSLQSGEVKLEYRYNDQELTLLASTDKLRKQLEKYFSRHGPPGVSEETVLAKRTKMEFNKKPVDIPCFEVMPWKEADQLFHRDPRWLGADVASTVDLGNNRILWLFGDSWIDLSGTGRRSARMVSNSIGIQEGLDPSMAKIRFYWREHNGTADAMFPDRNGESLWFGNGIRVGDKLLLFFARTIRNTGPGPGGFEHVGWTAFMVDNPDEDPARWKTRELPTPENPLGVLAGFAGVIKQGDHIIALGSQNPVKTHPVFAIRWKVGNAISGELMHPEWWAGDRHGWVPDSSKIQRYPIFENAQSELSLHFDSVSERFIAMHTDGFGSANLVLRASPTLEGPWSQTRSIYRPPEFYTTDIMIYAGKIHPELKGADLVATYATNSFNFNALFNDSKLYYPRFVRLFRCR